MICKCLLVDLVLLVFIGVTIGAPTIDEEGYYATKYDHLDVDTILNNRRMVNYYAACLLNVGPCPPQGLELKRILPEALATNCKRCTEKQKAVALRAIRRLKKEYPKVWAQLEEEWDPDNVLVSKFETSYGKKTTGNSKDQGKPQVANRFGDEDPSTNDVLPSSSTTSPSTVTFTSPPKQTTSTSSPIETSTKVTFTSKPSLINKLHTSTGKPPIFGGGKPPYNTLGANIQATVSFGTNVVGKMVRGLETLTKKVAETGVTLAGAVFSTISNVVRPVIL